MSIEKTEPNPTNFDRWLDSWQLPLPSDMVQKLYEEAWLNGWTEYHERSQTDLMPSAMALRCCAKAIHRLERNGLKRDAAVIREDLAA